MLDYIPNKYLNVLVFILPLFILFVVVWIKRDQKIDLDVEKCAGTWERLIAFLIDTTLCFSIFCLFKFLSKKLGLLLPENFEWFFFLTISWVYFVGFESSRKKATIGKIIEGIVVTDLKGDRVTFRRATLRFFATFISDMSFFGGHIMIAFTKYRQGLHDMLTDTLVQKK